MNDHSYYEELTAMAAGGNLSDSECVELCEHLAACPECQRREREFSDLVRSGLPLNQSNVFEFLDKKVRPEAGVRERFLKRAQSEGIRFSPEVEKPNSPFGQHFVSWAAGAVALAAVVLVAVVYEPYIPRIKASEAHAREVDRLKIENTTLTDRLAEFDRQVDAQQREIVELRRLAGNVARSAESKPVQARADQPGSQKAQLLDELKNRQKELADASAEIARINQLRATDGADLVAQQYRINEISDKLRIASATLDMERQLAAAGRDIRELMVARQLHVVDVRDTDENGKPSHAFARVFLIEGKSLMFYGFDLTEGKTINAKSGFQVWGVQLGKSASVHSLGLLSADDRTQNRWTLKVTNPALFSEIDSVFVTVTPPGGAKTPDGQRLLFARLGEANHP